VPIEREGKFLWTHDLGIASSIGIEAERLDACVAEAIERDARGVFGHPSFGFTQADVDPLARMPDLVQVWFWDVALRSIDGLYALRGLRHFGVHPKRPPVDFSRFPALESVVWIYEPRDQGLESAPSVRKLDLWQYKPRSKHFAGLALPPNLRELQINWANPDTLAGLPALPELRRLELHRCRKLASLDELPRIAPNLETLVVTTSGRLTDYTTLAALPKLKVALHDGRDVRAGDQALGTRHLTPAPASLPPGSIPPGVWRTPDSRCFIYRHARLSLYDRR
jgi:hypothetical protein